MGSTSTINKLEEQIKRIVENAISFASERQINVYTFSLYLDHESRAVSVCIDTYDNSKNTVTRQNLCNSSYFRRFVNEGNIESAVLWCANPGRNLSLGDYSYVNVAREDLLVNKSDNEICEIMLKTLISCEEAISKLSNEPEELLVSCSTADDELGLIWTINNAA